MTKCVKTYDIGYDLLYYKSLETNYYHLPKLNSSYSKNMYLHINLAPTDYVDNIIIIFIVHWLLRETGFIIL